MVQVPISRDKLKSMSYSDIVWMIALSKQELDARDKKVNDLNERLNAFNY